MNASVYFDVWGYHTTRGWEVLASLVAYELAEKFCEGIQKNTFATHGRLEIRKSEHVKSFEIGDTYVERWR